MSTRTLIAKMGKTINAAEVEFRVGRSVYKVEVPAGSRCCFLSGGTNGGRWVVDDLSFLNPNSAVYHDADHYGIPIPDTNVTEDARRT
ncbi:hypothetical protein ACM79J_29175 [Pseudomonas aeruginosa]|uniref:Uncharacterized protein n=3 Tax=Pseudomonas putida group TaxID=136845 RepID=A0A6B7Q270_9PSED|nr:MULTISPECIES: hypothetical protein [Pseudomonas]PYD14369.1 hypothetical protein DND47_15865 [Pseudomonas syringae pv. syringae]ENY79135.1 hypothetical protein C206_03424 [Pseudomonas putida TRO1]MCT8191715.1 hypothetical protein [Pseudomonas monteilii]POF99539.1 hypothetical protein BGP82_27195 [Pseudomonas putida]QFX76434.1 hypothetical protein [Pseudomonas monteilii]